MPSNKKFPVSKGFYGFKSDDAAFLKPDNTDPFEKGDHSGIGYSARYNDASGVSRGEYPLIY